MARSVLRVADQAVGRFPDRCVLSGTETDRAVRLIAPHWSGPGWMLGVPGVVLALRWLPGRPSEVVALPVSPTVWRRWRSRNLAALSVVAAGATFAGIGVVAGAIRLAVFGLVVLAGGVAYRTRAHHNYWTTCRFRPVEATIVVEPTHPEFDRQARDLFVRSIR